MPKRRRSPSRKKIATRFSRSSRRTITTTRIRSDGRVRCARTYRDRSASHRRRPRRSSTRRGSTPTTRRRSLATTRSWTPWRRSRFRAPRTLLRSEQSLQKRLVLVRVALAEADDDRVERRYDVQRLPARAARVEEILRSTGGAEPPSQAVARVGFRTFEARG